MTVTTQAQTNYSEVERRLAHATYAHEHADTVAEAWRGTVVECIGALAHAMLDIADALRDVAYQGRDLEPEEG
jgi:hypothetical protein